MTAKKPDTTEKQPLTVEHRQVADLKPYEQNARTHSKAQIKQIAASITEFGWTSPLLIDEQNRIIAGHGRADGARLLGMSEVPVIVISGLSEAQRRALILADNKIAENAGWDEDLLRAELATLSEWKFDLPLIGFDSKDLDRILRGNGGDNDPEEAPEAPVEPISQLGDIWQLGEHRIICGSSTDPDDVKALLGDERPHLMVTDPPYGVNYDPAWRKRLGGHKKAGAAIGRVLNDDQADWREAWALFPGDVAYVWHGALHTHEVAESLEVCGLELRSQIIWAKSRLVLSRADYHWKHESCWYAVRENKTSSFNGDRKQTTVWDIDTNQKNETGHGTQKPIDCMMIPIENNSRRGDAIYEPFAGSSTTLIACEMAGRRCFAVELSPAYVDVGVLRWQKVSGKDAILVGDGRTFNEITAAGRTSPE